MTKLEDIARKQVADDAHEINDIVLTMLNEYRLSKVVKERLRAVLDNSQRIARNVDSDADVKRIAHLDGVGDMLDGIMTALAQGVINITEGLTTIEANSRVHKAMSAVVEMHVAGKLHATRHSFERKAVGA